MARASTQLGKRGGLWPCPSPPFWLLLPFKAHTRHFPLAEGDREADGNRAEGAGEWANISSPISNTEHFSFSFFPPDMYSCLCMIHLVSPLPAAVPLCCHCSPVSRLRSTAALPLNDSFLTPPRTGKQESPSPLSPASGSASTCPPIPVLIPMGCPLPRPLCPLRSHPLAAQGTRRGSLTAR